jgi:hypothetical protein
MNRSQTTWRRMGLMMTKTDRPTRESTFHLPLLPRLTHSPSRLPLLQTTFKTTPITSTTPAHAVLLCGPCRSRRTPCVTSSVPQYTQTQQQHLPSASCPTHTHTYTNTLTHTHATHGPFASWPLVVAVSRRYARLAVMAITGLGGRARVVEIYQWIMDNHPYYKNGTQYWKVCLVLCHCIHC